MSKEVKFLKIKLFVQIYKNNTFISLNELSIILTVHNQTNLNSQLTHFFTGFISLSLFQGCSNMISRFSHLSSYFLEDFQTPPLPIGLRSYLNRPFQLNLLWNSNTKWLCSDLKYDNKMYQHGILFKNSYTNNISGNSNETSLIHTFYFHWYSINEFHLCNALLSVHKSVKQERK